MIVKFAKLDPKAVKPTYAKSGDAALDITAISRRYDNVGQYYEYNTGIAIAIPEGYVGLLFPRSSVSNKDLTLANCVGVIDSGYRGEITFRFKEMTKPFTVARNIYEPGERIGQLLLVPVPKIELALADRLDDTERGTGGYGSSGR